MHGNIISRVIEILWHYSRSNRYSEEKILKNLGSPLPIEFDDVYYILRNPL